MNGLEAGECTVRRTPDGPFIDRADETVMISLDFLAQCSSEWTFVTGDVLTLGAVNGDVKYRLDRTPLPPPWNDSIVGHRIGDWP